MCYRDFRLPVGEHPNIAASKSRCRYPEAQVRRIEQIMNPAPTSVVLVFALSEQGRRDAFRKGNAVQAAGENYGHFLQTIRLDVDSDPELFERAMSLDFYLSDDCETVEIPVCCYYSFSSDFWILGDSVRVSDSSFGDPYQFVHLPPSQPVFGPTGLADGDIAEAGFVQVLEDNPEVVGNYFIGLDYFPTVEDLLDEAEESRRDALVNVIPLEEAVAGLEQQYDEYVSAQRDFILGQFDTWIQTISPEEIPDERLKLYREHLSAISATSGYSEMRSVFIDEPVRLVGELAAAKEQFADRFALAWSKTNGSARLKRIATEGLLESSRAVYRDERLAFERPGWGWIPTAQKVSLRNPVAPGEDEFALLDAARELSPKAKLHYATLGKGSGCFVAVDSFLGRQIWFPGDALAEIKAAGK